MKPVFCLALEVSQKRGVTVKKCELTSKVLEGEVQLQVCIKMKMLWIETMLVRRHVRKDHSTFNACILFEVQHMNP